MTYNPNNEFQKIPKEEFFNGIDWEKIEKEWKEHVGNWETVGTKSAFDWFKSKINNFKI